MVFELKHYQGLRLRTIGEMLNTTEETAKNTLFRATKKVESTIGGPSLRQLGLRTGMDGGDLNQNLWDF